MIRKSALFLSLIVLSFAVVGCAKSGKSSGKTSTSSQDTVSENKGNFITVTLDDTKFEISDKSDQRSLLNRDFDDPVLDLPKLDSDYFVNISDYINYDTGTNEPLGRNDDGSITFSMLGLDFCYDQDIDIQILTSEEESIYFLVRGLDQLKSYMGVAIYSGDEYNDMYSSVKNEGHGLFDMNGHTYYVSQNTEGSLWYYAFDTNEGVKVVVIEHHGAFSLNHFKVAVSDSAE